MSLDLIKPFFGSFGFSVDPDEVTININGKQYNSWNAVKISKSLNSLAQSYQITTFDKWRETNENWPLQPNAAIDIGIGTDAALSGYVEKLIPVISNEDRKITFSGRNRAGDIVDSSALIDSKSASNIGLKELIEKMVSPFGLKVTEEVDTGSAFDSFTITNGETILDVMTRAANLKGVLLLSDTHGNIRIMNRGGGSAAGTGTSLVSAAKAGLAAAAAVSASVSSGVVLEQGINIKTINATYDETQRFQTYIAHGQVKANDESYSESGIEAQATDELMQRPRTLLVELDANANEKAATKRAEWERCVRAAKARKIVIGVKGWRKPDGTLWDVNEIVPVKAPSAGVSNEKLLISGVERIKNKDAGTITELTLTDPDAFKLDPTTVKGPLGWEPDVYKTVIKLAKFQ